MGRCKESRRFCGILTGLQENPPIHAVNQAPASGNVKVILKEHRMYVCGRFKNLSTPYTASHVHIGNPGINGPVVFPLTATLTNNQRNGSFDPCLNRFTLTNEQRDALLNGQYYVNIHTTQYPNGELRSQLLPKRKSTRCHKSECRQYLAILSGAEEVPPVETEATGKIVASLNGNKLKLNGSFTALGSDYTASHIHRGAAGVNGPVVFNLNATLNLPPLSGQYFLSDNIFILTESQKATLNASEFYVNIHTIDFPNGEIRGQLVPL